MGWEVHRISRQAGAYFGQKATNSRRRSHGTMHADSRHDDCYDVSRRTAHSSGRA
ncbi:hypothetical protein PLANPX_1549 [Lacipirellula parvula]|uniref:Uncharacterized protein n=1 Tax=Lacipirellula parvula TaxID=2650471 RepID=A0A5K7X807_9BACT|nr:hypothetical protein PLANPX_1549 [Lacipirellula parvula]